MSYNPDASPVREVYADLPSYYAAYPDALLSAEVEQYPELNPSITDAQLRSIRFIKNAMAAGTAAMEPFGLAGGAGLDNQGSQRTIRH